MVICEKDSCTGCSVCVSVCPKEAITLVEDDHGFAHPLIDEKRCVKCGLCKKVCPVHLQHKNKQTDDVFACWQLDEKKRFMATSGGVFTTVAEHFLSSGGIVYGAALESNCAVKHIRVSDVNDLSKLRGAKYAQSATSGIFEQVKYDLQAGTRVLFSGTPCQIAALKNYVGKAESGLYTIDVVCHGVASPKFFMDYLAHIRKKQGGEIATVNFRYKKPCWSVYSMRIEFTDGRVYIADKFQDPFLYLFSSKAGDLTLRRSCFTCQFTTPERIGDMTLGDFWNIKAERYAQRSIEQGTGLVLINSQKGQELFDSVKAQLYVERRNWSDANNSNRSLRQSWKKPERFEEFWTEYNQWGYEKAIQTFFDKEVADAEKRLRLRGAAKREHAYFFPYCLRKMLRTVKRTIMMRLK